MHHEDIKAAIRKRGSTPSEIARALGITHAAVSLVIRGSSTSARVAKRISDLTGLSLGQLWPGKYLKLEAQLAAKHQAPRGANRTATHTTARTPA